MTTHGYADELLGWSEAGGPSRARAGGPYTPGYRLFRPRRADSLNFFFPPNGSAVLLPPARNLRGGVPSGARHADSRGRSQSRRLQARARLFRACQGPRPRRTGRRPLGIEQLNVVHTHWSAQLGTRPPITPTRSFEKPIREPMGTTCARRKCSPGCSATSTGWRASLTLW